MWADRRRVVFEASLLFPSIPIQCLDAQSTKEVVCTADCVLRTDTEETDLEVRASHQALVSPGRCTTHIVLPSPTFDRNDSCGVLSLYWSVH